MIVLLNQCVCRTSWRIHLNVWTHSFLYYTKRLSEGTSTFGSIRFLCTWYSDFFLLAHSFACDCTQHRQGSHHKIYYLRLIAAGRSKRLWAFGIQCQLTGSNEGGNRVHAAKVNWGCPKPAGKLNDFAVRSELLFQLALINHTLLSVNLKAKPGWLPVHFMRGWNYNASCSQPYPFCYSNPHVKILGLNLALLIRTLTVAGHVLMISYWWDMTTAMCTELYSTVAPPSFKF